MQSRENALKEWLINTLQQKDFILKPLTGDASFRKYYRINYSGLSQIVMDAPPGKEDLVPFINVAKTLRNAAVRTPEIIAQDLQQGFLLLSDFGDELLLNHLKVDTVDAYYKQAIDTLLKIQQCPINDKALPSFDKAHMLQEMNLCPEWFLKAYLSLNLSQEEEDTVDSSLNWIATEVCKQPLTFIHRDYHSRNLMVIEGVAENNLGVIDFQDAMRGPITYDLVSLLKDCYISWPRADILRWIEIFYAKNSFAQEYSLSEFIRAFDICGLQRHIKVLGIFCRLYLRDKKPAYLQHLPLTLKYVLETTATYPELYPLFHLLQTKVSLA